MLPKYVSFRNISGTHVATHYAPFLLPQVASNLLGSESLLFELVLIKTVTLVQLLHNEVDGNEHNDVNDGIKQSNSC